MNKLTRFICSALLLIASLTAIHSIVGAKTSTIPDGNINGGAPIVYQEGVGSYTAQIIGYVQVNNWATTGANVFTPVGGKFNGVNYPNLNIINFTPYNLQFRAATGGITDDIMPYASATVDQFVLSGFNSASVGSIMGKQPLKNSVKIPLKNPNNMNLTSSTNNTTMVGGMPTGTYQSYVNVGIAAGGSSSYQQLLSFNVINMQCGEVPKDSVYTGAYWPYAFALQYGNQQRNTYVASQSWAQGNGVAAQNSYAPDNSTVMLMQLTNPGSAFDCYQMVKGVQTIPYTANSYGQYGYWQPFLTLNSMVFKNASSQLGGGAGVDVMAILQVGNNAEYSLIFVACANAADATISPSMYLK